MTAVLTGLGLTAQAQPTLTAVAPAANRATTARTAPITATFSQPLNAGSAAALRVFSAQHGGMRTGHSGTAAVNGNQLTFAPNGNWKPGETVRVAITTSAQNSTGQPLATPRLFEFTAATGGNGLGSFVPPAAPSASGAAPAQVLQLADLDSDGDLDLVTGNSIYLNGQLPTLSVRLNNGQGSFSGGSDMRATRNAVGANHMALGDVDSDGDIDILTTNAKDSVHVRLNNGLGAFPSGYNVLVNADAYRANHMVLADVDGDGDLDLLAYTQMYRSNSSGWPAQVTKNQLSLRLNDGLGHFGGGYDTDLGVGQYGRLATGDFDNDGDLDLIITGLNNSTVSVRLNNGSGTFAEQYRLNDQVHWGCMQPGDYDGDGDLDLLALDGNGRVYMYFNNGTGTLTLSARPSVQMRGNTYMISVGDIDADGDLDLVAGSGGRDLSVLFNDGQGTFTAYYTLVQGPFTLGDVDGDNDLDLVIDYRGFAPVAPYSIFTCYNEPVAPTLVTSSTSALAAQVGLYPNPAQQQCTLTLPAGVKATAATVANSLGQRVKVVPLTGTPATRALTLDLADLAPGVYTLLISTDAETITQRLLKQ